MRFATSPSRWLAALALTGVVAACDSSTDPVPDYDPQETLQQIEAVVDPLDLGIDVLDGIWNATEALEAYGAAPLAEMLRAATPSTPGRSVRASADLRSLADHVRPLRSSADPGTARLTFPNSVLGETLVWSTTQNAYVVEGGASSAPANGVRVIYYATAQDGYPSTPLTPLGYIEFTDEDRSLAERVGVQVVEYGSTGSQTLERADYFVELASTGTSSNGSLELEASGTTNDGAEAVEFDVVQLFSWSQSENVDELLMDYLFETARGTVSFIVEAEGQFEQQWNQIDMDIRFAQGSPQAVHVNLLIEYPSERLTGGIEKAGRTVIEVSGSDGDPQFTARGDERLTSGEIATLEQIWTGIGNTISLVEWLLVPAGLLYLAG